MKVKFVVNSLLIATLLLSRALIAAPYAESFSSAQVDASAHINASDAHAITAHLQTELYNDVREEMVQRIKADSRQELSRQLQDAEFFIDAVPATRNDFEITISNPDRKMRLTAR